MGKKLSIKKWLREQGHVKYLMEMGVLNESDLNHIANCMHAIFDWYWNDRPLGHFLTAVVRNDFVDACGRADSTNKLVLPVYATFLYNLVPADYSLKTLHPDAWRKRHET